MAFYNLRKTSGGPNLTCFEIYWYSYERTCRTLERHFSINFLEAYEVSKTYGEKQDEFVKELDALQTEFYDGIFYMVERRQLKVSLPLESDYKEGEAELKKIYDWFLPKQKAFAEKWGLRINVD